MRIWLKTFAQVCMSNVSLKQVVLCFYTYVFPCRAQLTLYSRRDLQLYHSKNVVGCVSAFMSLFVPFSKVSALDLRWRWLRWLWTSCVYWWSSSGAGCAWKTFRRPSDLCLGPLLTGDQLLNGGESQHKVDARFRPVAALAHSASFWMASALLMGL